MDMRKGTVKHIKVFQILSSFRNIILSVPTTFVQDCSVLSSVPTTFVQDCSVLKSSIVQVSRKQNLAPNI